MGSFATVTERGGDVLGATLDRHPHRVGVGIDAAVRASLAHLGLVVASPAVDLAVALHRATVVEAAGTVMMTLTYLSFVLHGE